MDVIVQCNHLLIQSDSFVANFVRVLGDQATPTERGQFADTYQTWYAAGQAVILDEVHELFDRAYTVAVGGYPSIQDMLTALRALPEPDRSQLTWTVWGFKFALEDQRQALLITRRHVFPRNAQIPYDLRYLIASICKRVYHEYSIERLFIDNGCLTTWWMLPLKPLDSSRMTQAMGWFDGIVFHAPTQEIPITRAVCEEILRKPRLAQHIQQELRRILDYLTPKDGTSQPPSPVEETQATQLIATHRRRLSILEVQAAMHGRNTPPEVAIEIEDLRRTIRELEHPE